MTRAVFFDIDGTLLSFSTHRMPASTLRALAALREKGIRLYISTGRPYADAAFLQEIFPFDGYVTLNGQYCLDGTGVIHKERIPREVVETIAEQAVRGGYICSFVDERGQFISAIDDTVRELFSLVNVKLPPVRDPRTALEKEIYQASVFLDKSREPELTRHLKGMETTRWHEAFLDIIPAGAGKQRGIEAVLRRYGMAREEIIAFGDGENDITMLQYAGTGVAMGDAAPAVKEAADYVTASVDEDGILKALLHLGVLTREETEAGSGRALPGEPEMDGSVHFGGNADAAPAADGEESDWQERTRLLVGDAGIRKLAGASVAVAGVGGVGGYAAEMLCRAGVGRLILVDADRVHPTNKNRQIIAADSTLGELKVETMARRLRDIHPQVELVLKADYLEPGGIGGVLGGERIDFLVDAIDTLAPKIALIRYCVEHRIPHVTSMGAGAKLDATAVRIADLSKSHNCPLAYVLRKKLRKEGISGGFPVVYSEELPDRRAIVPAEERNKKSRTGTISYLPAVFGCACAQAAVEFLLKDI